MRIQKIYCIITLLVVAGVGLYAVSSGRTQATNAGMPYHQSQFFRYTRFIESAVKEARSRGIIDLDQAMGGIVPHHIPTTIPVLAKFYAKLKNTRKVATFVILAPDHVDKGRGEISVSKSSFVMPFGTLAPDLAMIEEFEKSGFVVANEAPFDREHSIDSQLLLISKLFPDAKIVPLIFRSSITNEAAGAFGKVLASIADDATFVVSSVDFSHYLSQTQARPIDDLSAKVLGARDSLSAALVDADSTQALAAFVSFLEAKGANHHTDLQVFNTRDFNGNNDYTTGYVTGFWGLKRNVANVSGNSSPVTLLFVGDIMLSRTIGSLMAEKNDWQYPFLKIADFLKSADITFGNLESPISAGGMNAGSIYSFRADPRAIKGLLYAGFDVLSVANNHIWDYGSDAAGDTLTLLRNAGIGAVGAGTNYQEAHRPLVKEVRGLKISWLGYTNLLASSLGLKTAKPAIALLDISKAREDIRDARKIADIVVVSLHWGNEYETHRDQKQEKIARALIDAGANLVIGHHPHVVQEVEQYGRGYVAYSLGNFVFDQNFSEDTQNGLVLRVVLQNKNIVRIEKVLVKFNKTFQPFLIQNSPLPRRHGSWYFLSCFPQYFLI